MDEKSTLSSKNEGLWSKVEKFIFQVMFSLSKDKKYYEHERIKLFFFSLLHFCEFIGLLLLSQNFGPSTAEFGLILRWAVLAVDQPLYIDFVISYILASATVIVIVGLLIAVGKNASSEHLNLKLEAVFKCFMKIIFQWLFLAGLNIFLTPFFCNPYSNTLFIYPTESCTSWANIALMVVSIIMFTSIMILAYISALSNVNFNNIRFDPIVTSNVIYSSANFMLLFFIMFNQKFLVYFYGKYWECVLNIIGIGLCLVILVVHLPYHLEQTNEWQCGLRLAQFWIATISLINLNEGDPTENRSIDFILLLGIAPCLFIGAQVVKSRYWFIQSIAAGVVSELTLSEGKSAKVAGNRRPTMAPTTRVSNSDPEKVDEEDVNPRSLIPKAIRNYTSQEYFCELVGKILWFDSSFEKEPRKSRFQIVSKYYDIIENAFPESVRITLIRTTLLLGQGDDASTSMADKLDVLRKKSTCFANRYAFYQRSKELQNQRIKMAKTNLDNTLDLIGYVEVQKKTAEANKYGNDAIKAVRDFWSMFLQSSITLSQFRASVDVIEKRSNKALEFYKELILKHPKDPRILFGYATFLDLALNDTKEADKYMRLAEEMKLQEQDGSNIDGIQLNDQAIITISEEGVIENVNKAVTKFFGYAKTELEGRNIKIIVPSPYKEKHNMYLSSYIKTGEGTVMGNSRNLFGLHKQGYVFPMRLDLRETRNDTGKRSFVGMISSQDIDEELLYKGFVLTDQKGFIYMVNETVTRIFGYNAKELVGKNVTIFMNETYAAAHAGYLDRYLNTGEKKVIDRESRNVPGKKRNGQTFPIALSVEEVFIDEERYFQAHISDVSSIVGSVYIDGYGNIHNCDEKFCTLFGYSKSQLLGQNIKIIMPPPFNEFHDIYLERYRRTGKSTLIGAADFRLVPAVHADGSKMNIKIKVFRETQDGSDGQILIKGVVSRVDNTTEVLNEISKRGFKTNMKIEFTPNLTILKLDPVVLTDLGYDADEAEDFINQSMSVIIPPFDVNCMNNIWFKECSSTNDVGYVKLLRKDRTLLPAGILIVKENALKYVLYVTNLYAVDALITISSEGIVKNINGDSEALLGFPTSQVVGRNISRILPEEIAQHHDEYIQRYLDTGVATVIGIPRQLETVHRSGCNIPVEIQVTERVADEGKLFIGKIKHLELQDLLDRDFVQSLWKNIEEKAKEDVNLASMSTGILKKKGNFNQSSNSVTSEQQHTRRLRSTSNVSGNKLNETSTKGLVIKTAVDDEDDILNVNQPRSSKIVLGGETKVIPTPPNVLSNSMAKLENELKATQLHHSKSHESGMSGTSEGTSISGLSGLGNGNGGLLGLDNKISYIRNSNKVDVSITRLNIAIKATFLVLIIFLVTATSTVLMENFDLEYFDFYKDNTVGLMSAYDIISSALELDLQQSSAPSRGPCRWSTAPGSTVPTCQFILDSKYQPLQRINESLTRSQAIISRVASNMLEKYHEFRVPGDEYDTAIHKSLDMYMFQNKEHPDIATLSSFDGFFGLITKIDEISSTLLQSLNKTESTLEWNFLIANRDRIRSSFRDLISGLRHIIQEKSHGAEYVYLGCTIAIFALSTGLFLLIIIPHVRTIRAKEIEIIKSVVTIPKMFVADFVIRKYCVKEDEDDEEDMDEEDDPYEKKVAAGKDKYQTKVMKVLEKLKKKGLETTTVKIGWPFALYGGLFLAMFCISIPSAVRTGIYLKEDNVDRTSPLAYNLISLSCEILDDVYQSKILALQLLRECEVPLICSSFNQTKQDFQELSAELQKVFFQEFRTLSLENPFFQDIIFSNHRCLSMDPTRCYNLANSTISPSKITFMEPPSDIWLKTTHGLANLINNIVQSNQVLASSDLESTVSIDDVRFLYSAIPEEVVEIFEELNESIKLTLTRNSNKRNLINVQVYVFTICFVVVIYVLFEKTKRKLQIQSVQNRKVLTIIPVNIAKKSKVLKEVIDKEYTKLLD